MGKVYGTDAKRAEIIAKIYDVVLKPEKTQSFLKDWEAYISTVAEQELESNATSYNTELTLEDNELEAHFARVHAILEKLEASKQYSPLTDIEADSGVLFRLDVGGQIIEQSPKSISMFGNIESFATLTNFLDENSAKAWLEFIRNSHRAPSINRFQIFSMLEHGNLIVFNHRREAEELHELVVKHLSVHWTEELENVLSDHFGLTDRELDLARALSEMGSLDLISKNSNRSKNTLRTQMKSIFKKLKVSSQPQVTQSVALLAHFCDIVGFDSDKAEQKLQLGTAENIGIGKDKTIPVHFMGPKNGTPIIFLHGMLDGVAMTSRMIDQLEKHNFRFICPVRPNFGMADSEIETRNTPDIFAQQLVKLVHVLELKNFVLFGHMSGSLFAFAAASKLNGNCLGIVNVSGGVPILSSKQFSKQSLRQKAFAYTARYAPALFPALMKAGVNQIDNLGPKHMMFEMYPDDCLDRIVIEDDEIAEVIMDGYRFSIAHGYKGFEGDAYHVVRNWSQYVENNTKPALLLHGIDDRVVIPETVEEFSRRECFPVKIFDNAGQLVFYSHTDKILIEIRKFYDGLIN